MTPSLPIQRFVTFPEVPRLPSELSLAVAVLGSFFWGLLFPFWPLCTEVVKGWHFKCSMCRSLCFEQNKLWWGLVFQKSGINSQWNYPVHCLCNHMNSPLYRVVFDIKWLFYNTNIFVITNTLLCLFILLNPYFSFFSPPEWPTAH